MRKVSKSRIEDDVISSTNGSGSAAADDDQADQDQQDSGNLSDENDKDVTKTFPDQDESKSDNSPVASKKSSKGKAKGRKKKTEKTNKKVAVDEEYEVEKVVGSKRIKGKLHYLIRWKGYGANSDTWEPENTLSCPDLITKYNESQKENSKSKATPKGKKRKSVGKSKGASASKRSKSADTDDESEDEDAEYEVERILEVHHKKNGEREFHIHWKGWSNKFDSWEPESNLNCPELIKKFMNKVTAARSKESRNLRVAPESTNRFTLQDPSSGRRLSKRRGQRQRVRYDNAE